MAITPQIRVTQARAFSAFTGETPELRVSQARAMAAINFPTVSIRASQARAFVADAGVTPQMRVSQARVMVAIRGRPQNTRIRDWTFSLDGHDFYVLRLGDDETLIYDATTEQWVDWADRDLPFWRANVGMTWQGAASLASNYGSSVVVGDDNYGLLWLLDPEQPYDENPDYLAAEQEIYFERIVMGQMVIRGRTAIPNYTAFLTADMGAPAYPGAGVTLYTSDDGGVTFDSHDLVTVTLDEADPELSWYSLGQAEAPGRLFKIVDDGAIARVDSLEIDVG